ncbi:MAG: tetratricopeptide repeat protein, partial [Pseudomonadales bacterium]|nr:tetratricopeptide repeat protein [Pseudomonadales bacterium]
VHMEQVKNLGGSARFEVFAYQAASLPADKRLTLLAAIEEMSARHPGDGQLKFSKAILLQQEGLHAEALLIADEILASEEDVNVIILKITTLNALGRQEQARTFLTTQVEAMPTNRRLRLFLARLLFEGGNLAGAQVQYEEVLEKAPNDGDVLFALALIAMQNENDTEAKRYLERMVRWNRRAGEAHYYLGSLAERSSDATAALDHYRQVGNGYEYVPAQARIGSILVEDGLWDEARENLSRARHQQPDKAQQLMLLEAQLLADRGLESDVFEFLDGVIGEDPRNMELLYFRAMAGQQFGYLEILEADLRRIIEIDPDNADALNALGYTLTDQTDRHEEAMELIEKALAIKPDEAAFIDSMGWVQFRLENYEAAIFHLRKALALF